MVAITGNAIPPQRKRTLDALNLVEPDRVPTGLWGTVEGYSCSRPIPGLTLMTKLLGRFTDAGDDPSRMCPRVG